MVFLSNCYGSEIGKYNAEYDNLAPLLDLFSLQLYNLGNSETLLATFK